MIYAGPNNFDPGPGPGSYNIAAKAKRPPKYILKNATSTIVRSPTETT
jgi:hypothetical protein